MVFMVDYLHTPKNTLELDKWNFFVDKSKSMPKNIQELISKKLQGGTIVWWYTTLHTHH
jgi:mitochondrial fission protein ELM1